MVLASHAVGHALMIPRTTLHPASGAFCSSARTQNTNACALHAGPAAFTVALSRHSSPCISVRRLDTRTALPLIVAHRVTAKVGWLSLCVSVSVSESKVAAVGRGARLACYCIAVCRKWSCVC
jgi:hypothetical protein